MMPNTSVQDQGSSTLLVSRHPGAVDWLCEEASRHGWSPTKVVAHLEGIAPETIQRVAGTVPLMLMHRLLAAGVEVWYLHLPQAALTERGQEHSAETMTQRGARLVRVRAIELDEKGE